MAVSIDVASGREVTAFDFECNSIKDATSDGRALVTKQIGSEEQICLVSATKGFQAAIERSGSRSFGQMQIYRDEIVGVRYTETPGYAEIAKWNLAGGFRQPIAGIHPPTTSPSFSIADHAGGLACVTRGYLLIVLCSTGQVLGKVEPNPGTKFENPCVITNDGTLCIVSMGPDRVAIVDTRAFRILATRNVPSAVLAVSKNGRFCASAGGQEENNPLVSWEIESGRIVDATTTDTEVDALALSPTGSLLAWAGPRGEQPDDAQVFVRDLTGKRRTILGPIVHTPDRRLSNAKIELTRANERAKRIEMIAELVQGALLGSWYDPRDKPTVEIYDEYEAGGRVTLHFVAEHYQYEHAQSGSDWADHYLFAGYSTFERAWCVDAKITSSKHQRISEPSVDDYDTRVKSQAWRAAAIARTKAQLAAPRPLAAIIPSADRPLPPVGVALRFMDCINRCDLEGLVGLMAEGHELRVLDEPPIVGIAANRKAWQDYMTTYPRYVIHPNRIAEREGRVALLGSTTGSHLGLSDEEERLRTVIWIAYVDGQNLRSWTIAQYSRELEKELGLVSEAHARDAAPSGYIAGMKRAVTVPPAARRAFVVALKGESRHWAALPDPLPMGRVLRIVDKHSDSDQLLKVFADRDDKGYFLDYFLTDSDRDGHTFWHGRIRDDGTIEDLENYEGQWGRPVFPDDPAKTEAELQRIIAHNTRVEEILRAKGFK